MSQFLPANHDAGDANTVGGYQAVHSRPAAFEGKDGASYSVDIVVDEVREPAGRFGAYLLFVHWRRGDPSASGHLETDYIAFGETEDEARATLGSMRLSEAKSALDALISRDAQPSRPWYDVMRES